MELRELLPLLTSAKVLKFKSKDFEIEFDRSESGSSTEEIKKTIAASEANLPPELRADDLMNADKVLNWSAGGQEDGPVPLTGDVPLSEDA